jgi:integrase
MPRKLRSSFETASSRLKLPVQKKPHWQRLGPGLSLGYRRNQTAGSWSVRASDGHGDEWLKRFGLADDHEPADGRRIFNYDQAVSEARKLVNRDVAEDPTKPITLDQALTQYERDLTARGARVYNAKQPRRHLTASLLSKPLVLISADELTHWRDGLIRKGMAPATINRIRNSLLAALELTAKARSHVWKAGLETLPDTQRARNVVLADAQVLALVDTAYRHDAALGLLCDVLAATGCRPSQAVRLLVEDLRAGAKPKLMMPASGKGGGRNRSEKKLRRYPVPILPALALKLKGAAVGRAGDAPLLLRSSGEPWNPDNAHGDYRDDIREVITRCGHDPDVVTMYALRHSSITRALLRNVPVRIVAAGHNTSTTMLERYYSAYIQDHADDITRAALLHPEPDTDKIIPLARR